MVSVGAVRAAPHRLRRYIVAFVKLATVFVNVAHVMQSTSGKNRSSVRYAMIATLAGVRLAMMQENSRRPCFGSVHLLKLEYAGAASLHRHEPRQASMDFVSAAVRIDTVRVVAKISWIRV